MDLISFQDKYTQQQIISFLDNPLLLLLNEPKQPNRNIINIDLNYNILYNRTNLKYIQYTYNHNEICTEVFEKFKKIWRRRMNQS